MRWYCFPEILVDKRDPGLQAERTALAWNRTGMGLLVNAALLLRCGSTVRDAAVLATGGLLLFGAALALAFAACRGRVLARPMSARSSPVSERACAALGLLCLVGGAGGLLGVLTVARA